MISGEMKVLPQPRVRTLGVRNADRYASRPSVRGATLFGGIWIGAG
jgi:hypothetical protein